MYQKKSKEQWEQEALLREGEAFAAYSGQFQMVTGNNQGQALLIAHELRQLREQIKWLTNAVKKMTPASDDKVPF